MWGIPDSQQEIYDNGENDALAVVDHRPRTEPKHGQPNNDIEENEPVLRVLRVCFDQDSDPKFEHKENLALAFELGVGRVDNWYRKQRLALVGSIPYIRVSDSAQDIHIEATGDANEAFLNYCFDKDPDPHFEDKDKLAKILRTTVGYIDEWHRRKRLAFQASPLSNSNLDNQLGSAQSDSTGQRNVYAWTNGNEQPNDANKRNCSSLQSTGSTLNFPASATFSLLHRAGLDERSETSQTTAASSSNQSQIPRFKCTFPGCPRACGSVADQVRHEHEVHWREEYFPCLLCSIFCTTNGLFVCCFCSKQFRELKAIEKHILGPCDLPKVVKESHHRYAHAQSHQKTFHPSTSEFKVANKNYLKCSFCPRKFDQNEDPKHHVCDKKTAWQAQQGLKKLFDSEAESTIWAKEGLKGWAFRIEGGYPVQWPTECNFSTCSKTFDSLKKRAIHFDDVHYVPSPTVLKRGFSDSGIEYAGDDDEDTLAESSQHDNRSQHGSTTEPRWRRRHPRQQHVQLSDEVRSMDLAGVVDERLPANPP